MNQSTNPQKLTQPCRICLNDKPNNEFGSRSDGKNYYCKPCLSIKRAAKRDTTKAYNKVYKQENKARLSEYHKEYQRSRYNADAEFKYTVKIRNFVAASYRRRGVKKAGKVIEVIGCTAEDFKVHLIQTALTNYGWWTDRTEYHIDHILPLASAKTRDEVTALTHYTNLQLLTPEDNMHKSSKVFE